ncbi:MAG: tRNA (guanosine(37)-N1)-methyltransferase TrmD [Pseudomonadota bacterium]
MRFDLVTLCPSLFNSFLGESLIGKALDKRAFEVRVIDIRDYTQDRHRTADDRPFGGGPGMVLRPEPVSRAIRWALATAPEKSRSRVVLLTPSGRPLNQSRVEEFSRLDHLVLVCGRYEGVDERVSRSLIDDEISIGDYVLSGGEVPAMVVIEAVARLLPGVLGKSESTVEETFQQGLLEYPQYTRPRVFEQMEVPEVLLSGDHAAIRLWRLRQSLVRTLKRRPDMLDRARLSPQAVELLREAELEVEEKNNEKSLDFQEAGE